MSSDRERAKAPTWMMNSREKQAELWSTSGRCAPDVSIHRFPHERDILPSPYTKITITYFLRRL